MLLDDDPLAFDQATIQSAINDLFINADWGDPQEYDLTVKRSGKNLDTEYSVIPSPKKDVPPEAKRAIGETKLDLDALFSGADPFAGGVGSKDDEFDKVVESASETTVE